MDMKPRKQSTLRSNMKFLVLGVALLAVFTLPPIIAGTPSYPLAVVSGNSMVPALHPGDMVVLRGVPAGQTIPNGTIIAYIPGQTGVSMLDPIIRPVVVHRVVNEFYQNGTVLYTTKGDNNIIVDSPSFSQKDVIGEVAFVIPRAGFVITFFTSATGMVAVIGVIVLLYLGTAQDKTDEAAAQVKLLRAFYRLAEAGQLPMEKFSEIERSIVYSSGEDASLEVKSLRQWWKPRSDKECIVEQTVCPRCGGEAFLIRVKKSEHTFCPGCKAPAKSD